MTFQMNIDHRVKIVFRHVPNHPFTQHAGNVDQDVDFAKAVDALRYHAAGFLVIGNTVVVGDGAAASGPYLRDDIVGRPLVGSFAAATHAGVVDDDAGALFGQE